MLSALNFPKLAIAAVLTLVAVATASAQERPTPTSARQGSPTKYQNQFEAEANSRDLCEAVSNRVHVQFPGGSECISYFITPKPASSAVQPVLSTGDIPTEAISTSNDKLADAHRAIQHLSEATQTQFVYVSRPGLFGSSGNHGLRRRPGEMLAMNGAVDAIKVRHGIGQIVLAGQSGGSTVAASLLTLGRQDVACAVLGSGGFEVIKNFQRRGTRRDVEQLRREYFDPSERFTDIVADPMRRVFCGNPKRSRTLFEQQQSFADSLRGRGHHVLTVEAIGTGELMHGVTYLTLPMASRCSRGFSDHEISQYAEAQKRRLKSKRGNKPAQTSP